MSPCKCRLDYTPKILNILVTSKLTLFVTSRLTLFVTNALFQHRQILIFGYKIYKVDFLTVFSDLLAPR